MTRPAFAIAALLLTTACTHEIRIARTRPPRLDLATDRKLAIEVKAGDEHGVPTATDAARAVVGLTRGQLVQPVMATVPVRDDLTRVLRNAHRTLVDPAQADLLLKAEPTSWKWRGPLPMQRGTGTGTLHVRVDVFDRRAPGEPLVFTETYWASAEARNEGEALLRASDRLAREFLRDLEPVKVWARVQLDDSDPVTRPGIELCDRGKFEAAHQAFTDIVARHPGSAPALYNLAVLEEARGELDRAEALLVDATRLNAKPLYYEAIERVRRTRAEVQSATPR